MSMNILIVGLRDVLVLATNRRETQSTYFEAYQTPTRVTYAIEKSDNPTQTYIEYVESFGQEITVPRYAEDDPFEMGDPIGQDTYNLALDHIEEFKEWLAMCEKSGYTVHYEVI